MDLLERFPRAWCRTCEKVQPIILDVMKANDKNDHDAADIVCEECKSIIVTLHAPSAPQSDCGSSGCRRKLVTYPNLWHSYAKRRKRPS
jgi:hypothetical protein